MPINKVFVILKTSTWNLAFRCCLERLRDSIAFLSTEAVEGLALPLECIDYVHGRDSLAAGVLSVGYGVADDILKEDLEDTSGLFVDEPGDTLDATTTGKSA
eukprot:CAMPEP_0197465960 /NCGR_PEP_ID=MMETSP1175-20131217/64806_1 /TAXON_ID=1003142 /ORGANISM="Triceratium dubium, Strain CCMP147" /LENGTH=101 /DNA_ID=CAMNT_0043001987 /DNA_START=103 /DNA_END=408 /DNA_ORIENTATION=+